MQNHFQSWHKATNIASTDINLIKDILVEVPSCELYEIFKNIYIVNVCKGLPLRNNIFTRVPFRKMLGFCYKRDRQLFYHEGTSSYILLKILERVNEVIFNSSELLFLNIPQQTKTCSKSTTTECFMNVIQVSL